MHIQVSLHVLFKLLFLPKQEDPIWRLESLKCPMALVNDGVHVCVCIPAFLSYVRVLAYSNRYL